MLSLSMEIVEGFIISVEVVFTCCFKMFEMFGFRGFLRFSFDFEGNFGGF